MLSPLLLALPAALWARGAQALGQPACVSFQSSQGALALAASGSAAPLLHAPDEWSGVRRAAADFAADLKAVTGVAPTLANATASAVAAAAKGKTPILVGTLGHSTLIDAVVDHAKLDVSDVRGKWEAWSAKLVKNPLPGVSQAYVIMGADKRGTIYALYEHSEQSGVSPWYWWADVPVAKHAALYVSPAGCSHGTPTVQYRGIFINDEQPAIQSWAQEKFTNGTGAPFNAKFYAHLFELLLRLKANYLWPAMWSGMFAIDDPLNQPLADMYGIVMGTSHQEPMMRSTPNEWSMTPRGAWDWTKNADNITQYWTEGAARARPYESLYTLGMRGLGDIPLGEDTNIKLLEDIITKQRQVISTTYNTSDPSTVPQLWALYKEVQDYYDHGLRVPDDVCLLWTDDNWGNIRRLPLENERNRTGGAGVYYHFDYVGDPRDYKWITTTQLSKVYEQLSLALERDAKRVWIVNVGDLKPYEREIEFFLSLGYDASKWNARNLDTFVHAWAQREFALSAADAATVAGVVSDLTRYNARRKPELLNATTYALWDYREADRVGADWDDLVRRSDRIYKKLTSQARPAYFQLVHHPVRAAATLGAMWIASGTNALRASQARLSANGQADVVEAMFERDSELEEEYHGLLDGKWNHIMDQTHVMYYYWQQPMTNTMPPITRVQAKKQALPGPMRIVPEGYQGAWPGDNPYQCALGYNCPAPSLHLDPYLPQPSKFIDVGSGGPASFTFAAAANVSWLTLTPASGALSPKKPEQRVEVAVDWAKAPKGLGYASVVLNATAKGQPMQTFQVAVYANRTVVPADFHGFVEGDGGIAIEAAHASRNTSVGDVAWAEIPGYGRTLSGVTPWPREANGGRNYTAGTGPSIEYDFYNFNTKDGQNVSVTAHVAPSLNANGNDRPIGLALQVDGGTPFVSHFIAYAPATANPPGWAGLDGFVANAVVPVTGNFTALPGKHTLKVWMIEPAVVLQRIVIDTGNVRKSYLGPPESKRV